MSETTWVRIQIRKKDLDKANEATCGEFNTDAYRYVDDEDEKTITQYFECVKSGGDDIVFDLFKNQIPYIGEHGNGYGEYCPMQFCSDGKEQFEIWCDDDGSFMCRLDENGDPSQSDIEDVKAYISKVKVVKEILDK